MKNYKVAFFTEAGKQRGMGHLVRCMAIRDKAYVFGMEVDFYLDSDIDFSEKYPEIFSFKWDTLSLPSKKYDIVFIDSYEAKIELYQKVSDACHVAVFIDDYRRLEYPKGFILNISPDAKVKFYPTCNSLNHYLLGLNYVPIREKFLCRRPQKKEHLFIMMGGTDILNLSVQIVRILYDMKVPIVVVVNKKSNVKQLTNCMNVKVLYQVEDDTLISYMEKAFCAITTASMSAYELCYLSIPTIVVATSPNQVIGVKSLIDYGVVNAYINIEDKKWKKSLKETVQKVKSCQSVGAKIDGLGAQRVIDAILETLQ